jgi:hypothetical protein
MLKNLSIGLRILALASGSLPLPVVSAGAGRYKQQVAA